MGYLWFYTLLLIRLKRIIQDTFHVDVRTRRFNDACWSPCNLLKGINFHLVRQSKDDLIHHQYHHRRQHPSKQLLVPHNPEHDVRILSCRLANHRVRKNLYPTSDKDDLTENMDWNARFTATSRTYCYRILHLVHPTNILHTANTDTSSWSFSCDDEYIIPFETGRSWLVRGDTPLNVNTMQQASTLLIGKHDFSSFRAKGCERSSPVVQINNIHITSEPIPYPFWLSNTSTLVSNLPNNKGSMNLITIMIRGESFLYRQVRNMVGCLITVGQDKLSVDNVKDILQARDRRKAPLMAPAHGLYLVDVQHYWH